MSLDYLGWNSLENERYFGKIINVAKDMLRKQSIKFFGKDYFDEELTKIRKRKENLKGIYEQLVNSLTNKGGWSGIHKKLKREESKLDEKLCGYSPHRIIELGEEQLKRRISPIVKSEYQLKQFVRGCIEGAEFLSKFNNVNEFYGFIDRNSGTVENRWELTRSISSKIHGVGKALACEFLIGIGVAKFSKPDRHLKSILHELKLLPQKTQREDRKAFVMIDEIARANNMEPIEVDKILWMIGSGKWSVDGYRKHPPLKEKYMKSVKLIKDI